MGSNNCIFQVKRVAEGSWSHLERINGETYGKYLSEYTEGKRNPSAGNIPLIGRQGEDKIGNNAEECLVPAYNSCLKGTKMVSLIAKYQ